MNPQTEVYLSTIRDSGEGADGEVHSRGLRPSWDVGSQVAGIEGRELLDMGGPLRCGVDEDTTAHISRCLSDVFCPADGSDLDQEPYGDPYRAPLSSQRDGSNGLWSACLSFHIIKGQCCSNEKGLCGHYCCRHNHTIWILSKITHLRLVKLIPGDSVYCLTPSTHPAQCILLSQQPCHYWVSVEA